MTNDYGNLELHTVLLSAMKDIDKICRENGLKYFLYAGSVLGIFNHGGFIPWDDDIDIVMFKEDFELLYNLIEQEYKGIYHIKSFENTKQHYSKMYKFEIERTMFISNHGEQFPINIDISILHSVPNIKFLRIIQKKQIEILNLSLAVLSGGVIPISILSKLTIKQFARLGKEKLGKKLDKVMSRYDHKETKYVGIMCNTLTRNPYTGVSGYDNDITLRIDHSNPIDISFEGHSFMTFANPKEDLNRRYGSEWNKPYPEEKRVTKHDVKSYYISQEVRERVGL